MPPRIKPAEAIDRLVREFTKSLDQLVRRAVAEQLEAAVQRELGRRGGPSHEAPIAAPGGAPARKKRMCPVLGCTKPAAGPKYRWRCRDHKEVSTEQIALDRQKASLAVKLPPARGPRPGRPPPPLECRVPGCTVKSRGPRYEFFCGDHYKQLNKDERRAMAEQWKAARAQRAAAGAAAPVAPAPVIIRKAAGEPKVEPTAPPAPAMEAAPVSADPTAPTAPTPEPT